MGCLAPDCGAETTPMDNTPSNRPRRRRGARPRPLAAAFFPTEFPLNPLRCGRLLAIAFLVASLAPAQAGAAAGIVVPSGAVFQVPAAGLVSTRPITGDRTLVSPPGADLLIVSPAAVVVRGTVAAGSGAPGQAGGAIDVHAASFTLAPEGTLSAGAGGHGAPSW